MDSSVLLFLGLSEGKKVILELLVGFQPLLAWVCRAGNRDKNPRKVLEGESARVGTQRALVAGGFGALSHSSVLSLWRRPLLGAPEVWGCGWPLGTPLPQPLMATAARKPDAQLSGRAGSSPATRPGAMSPGNW